jgi:TonB-linked SusC/RagA family outer membrane protein
VFGLKKWENELEDFKGGTGLKDNGGLASSYSLLSYFGKVNYSYADKYLASVTMRYDGSSRFGKNNQFAVFPAFSLGWRVNQENFIKDNVSEISDLKFRFGWGQTGNSEISNNATQTIYSTNYAGGDPTWRSLDGTAYDLNGNKTGTLPSGYQKVQSGNDNLKWEATTQTNIGLDFGFFNQSLYGSVDYFVKDTKDILVQPAYIAVVGEGGSQWLNGASMNNTGFEMVLGYRGKIGNDFKYDISGNIGTYKNKIVNLPDAVVNTYGGNGLGDNILGHSWGARYGYVADGLFRTQDEVDNSAVQNGKGLGRMRFKDLNGDGTIDTKDQTWILNPTPACTYGLNFNFEYKGFDLTVFFQGVGNVNVENVVKYSSDFWSVRENNSNKGANLLNAWSPTNTSSTIPALTSSDANAEGRFSTYFIENGAYAKLRNLQLGYTIPKEITKKLSISNLHLYVSGQNLFTIKSKSFTGIDPESPSYGYPIPTMLTAGLNVSF